MKIPQDVQDKKAEIGINLSVVIQGLLLAATIGFGTRIVEAVDNLTIEVARLSTVTTINQSEIGHIRNSIVEIKARIIKLEDEK